MRLFLFLSVLISFVFYSDSSFASVTEGTIDPAYSLAWSENVGWIDFGSPAGDVLITDSALSGSAYGENIGWINLNSVTNTSAGVLSGYAWGENVGWIDFSGVTIGAEGVFSGQAYGENIGWITFGTGHNKVLTDWRPLSARPVAVEVTTSNNHSSSGSRPRQTDAVAPVTPTSATWWNPLTWFDAASTIYVKDTSTPNAADPSLPKISPPTIAQVPPEPFSALPVNLRLLTNNFPSLTSLFNRFQVETVSDLARVANQPLTLPTFSETPIPPPELFFARSQQQNLELPLQLTIAADGSTSQKLALLPNTKVELTVKPDHPAKEVVGYLVLDNKVANTEQRAFFAQASTSPVDQKKRSQLASLAALDLAPSTSGGQAKEIEERFVVDRFEYLDADRDGLYTATLTSPVVAGTYEVITVITYEKIELGKKELRLTTVVDPEGYIYALIGETEVRLPKATVSLWQANPKTGKYQLWPASQFKQQNPQVTDQRGTYSFLVPPGKYYLTITAPGYNDVTGPIMEVLATEGVHTNFQLKPTVWQRFRLMWQSLVS